MSTTKVHIKTPRNILDDVRAALPTTKAVLVARLDNDDTVAFDWSLMSLRDLTFIKANLDRIVDMQLTAPSTPEGAQHLRAAG